MAHNFAWKELPILLRYQKQQLYLDNAFRLIYNPGLFSSVLLSLITSSSGFFTAVHRIEPDLSPLIIGQLYCSSTSASARVVFLAPKHVNSWAESGNLLSHLIARAGEQGAFQVLAEVDLDDPVEDLLFQAGFHAYAEQQIWKVPRRFPCGSGNKYWTPISRADNDQVVSFYQRTVPGSVQWVEPAPSFPKVEGMISRQEGNLVGFAETKFGPKGILVYLVIASEISDVDEYLAALLFSLPYRNTRDVYLRIRSYQERIASALDRIGAEPGPRQKAVVKRLAVHYNAKQTFNYQAFEKQPDITTPISNTEIKN
ncbi:MAG: hypothetical protein MUO54_06670 [Anaerolineales bacterium]|nr:hypothetical protein [Anaerolineales bacterium]